MTRLYDIFKTNYFLDSEVEIDVDNITPQDDDYELYREKVWDLAGDIYEMIIDYMLDEIGENYTVQKETKLIPDWKKHLPEGSLVDEIVHTEDWKYIEENCIKSLKEAHVGSYLCEFLVEDIVNSFGF